MSEVIETTGSTVFVDDHGLLNIVSNGKHSTADSARETFTAARSLIERPVPTLFDARLWPRPGSGFWVTFIDLLPSTVSAGAILISPGSRDVLGAFPDAVNRLMVPFEVFDSREAATAFLMQFAPDPSEPGEAPAG